MFLQRTGGRERKGKKEKEQRVWKTNVSISLVIFVGAIVAGLSAEMKIQYRTAGAGGPSGAARQI
jgi:hypothetical protein